MTNKSALINRIICLSFILIFVLSLCSCVNRFTVKVDSHAHNYVKESFLFENKIKGAVYKNPYYDPENSIYDPFDPENGEYIWNEEGPRTLYFIIEDEKTYSEIFTDEAPSIDFEKKMVILLIYWDCEPNLTHYIRSIKLKNNELSVSLSSTISIGNGSTWPYPRCTTLTMNKTEITNVYFDTP